MSILLPCELSTWSSVTSYLEVLASGLDSVQDVMVAMLQIHDLCNVAILNPEDARPHDECMFDEFYEVIQHQFTDQDRTRFLKKTLPCIAKYAGALPELKPTCQSDFDYILASKSANVKLDRRFVASIAANAFLSTLPVKSKNLWPLNMPDLSFHTLFPSLNKNFISALRFKGFLEYFDLLEEEGPCGRISYNLKINNTKQFHEKNNTKLENNPTTTNNVQNNIIPRKVLSPVFIVEEDVRPLDLTTNLDSLIIKDLTNLTDMNLQHPELIPLIMMAEPILKENEWFEVKGLMSRSSNSNTVSAAGNGSHHNNSPKTNQQNDEACVCIIERSNALEQSHIFLAQGTCSSILENSLALVDQDMENVESSDERSKLSTAKSKSSNILPSTLSEVESKKVGCRNNIRSMMKSNDNTTSTSSDFSDSNCNNSSRPKRQCFEERLKSALQRGDTPDDDDEDNLDSNNKVLENNVLTDPSCPNIPEQSFQEMMKRRFNNPNDELEEKMIRSSNHKSLVQQNDDNDLTRTSSSFANDSVYSFESLILPYNMDGEYEDLQLSLVKPLHADENCKLRSLAITDELKRMSLSETYIDKCLRLDKNTQQKLRVHDHHHNCFSSRRYQSDLGRPFHIQKFRQNSNKQNQPQLNDETSSNKLPIWIITQSEEVDSKRFLVEWLAASIHDVPLVVYQAANGSICTDVVAAICSWIEEQAWTTQELQNALTQGNSSF